MSFAMSIFNNSALIQKQAVNDILDQNDFTSRLGLVLTEKQAAALTETRYEALNHNGRIEFGGGVISKLIAKFYDSPFISEENYEQTLHELIDIFYYYKNVTLDMISDDALIDYIQKAFNEECQGSIELLCGIALERLLSNLKRINDPEPYSYTDSDESEAYDNGEY